MEIEHVKKCPEKKYWYHLVLASVVEHRSETSSTDSEPRIKMLIHSIVSVVDFCKLFVPNGYLIGQSQQWKDQNSVSNLFKVNNKDTRLEVVLVSLLLTKGFLVFPGGIKWEFWSEIG